MLRSLITILALLTAFQGTAQYYIRGDVKDINNEPLQNVKIFMPATRQVFFSGFGGGYGIPSRHEFDSLIFTKDGYDTVALRINTSEYLKVVMRVSQRDNTPVVQKMASFTIGAEENQTTIATYYGETYTRLIENDFVKTNKTAQTTFGLRIDKASYSNIRRFINQNMEVPPSAVRIDEMLNYFNFNYKEPGGDTVFRTESRITDCPWNPDNRLLYMNISARKVDLSKVPPSNFVFLIDVSGSMDLPNRLPLLKEAFQLFVRNLRSIDTVSIVIYGGTVGVWLPPTGGDSKEKISEAIEELAASGDTPGEAALRTAYKLAKSTFIEGGNNRIILATDGDFNVGIHDEKELEELIVKEKESGVYLTCLGVGMGNYKDSKIEVLAKKGNGNFGYIDDIKEAERILVMQFTQTMYSVAENVYLDVKFNPDVVEQYRLLGYDNKVSEFKNVIGEPEGGEIGSGAGNTILFELKPASKDSMLSDLPVADFTIHYQLPGDTTEITQKYESIYNYLPLIEMPQSLQFATALAMLGLKLKKSKHIPDFSWKLISKLAAETALPGDYLQNQFIELTDKSEKIYTKKRSRKR
ncbi:MAG: von Willebrand factor type A domain-containing protein [Chitinophagaceae bacterium]|nr:von Willebrand factor type A domain-containing protein [Chitinophagaceae bacterium]